jgi:hypothetical protein
MRDVDRALDGVILDANQQCGVAFTQETARRGQPRNAKPLLDQRIDSWIGDRIFGDKHKQFHLDYLFAADSARHYKALYLERQYATIDR